MHVKKVIQLEDGTYHCDCEFNQEEMDSIVEIGLNVLLAHGALPFQQKEDEEDGVYEVIPPSQLMN